jgi:hypothetical protein
MKLQGICISLFLLLLISGCASAQAGQSSTASPSMLQVIRVNTNRYTPQYPPLRETIRDPVIIQKIYQSAFKLPAPAQIGRSCLVSTGDLIYRLDFYRGKTFLQEMKLGVTGCQFLLLSKTDGRIPDGTFLLLVEQALYLKSLVPQNS